MFHMLDGANQGQDICYLSILQICPVWESRRNTFVERRQREIPFKIFHNVENTENMSNKTSLPNKNEVALNIIRCMWQKATVHHPTCAASCRMSLNPEEKQIRVDREKEKIGLKTLEIHFPGFQELKWIGLVKLIWSLQDPLSIIARPKPQFDENFISPTGRKTHWTK